MKKGYWVVAYRAISDESAVKAYGALAVPALEAFGGRLLTKSTGQVQPHEAGLPLRTIVVEFESYETALAAHESDAYKKATSRTSLRRGTGFSHRRRCVRFCAGQNPCSQRPTVIGFHKVRVARKTGAEGDHRPEELDHLAWLQSITFSP
jgi:uncharacterized protein (DUF1330 family)